MLNAIPGLPPFPCACPCVPNPSRLSPRPLTGNPCFTGSAAPKSIRSVLGALLVPSRSFLWCESFCLWPAPATFSGVCVCCGVSWPEVAAAGLGLFSSEGG